MKSIYPIIALFLSFLFTFFSCSKEGSNIIANTENGVYTFSFTPAESEISTEWLSGDAIGISAYKSGTNNIYSPNINKQYVASNNSLFFPATNSDEIFQVLAGHSVDFIAYYPYKADIYDNYNISLSNQASQKDIDLLYSNNANNKTKGSNNIEFVFEHALSKIVINTIPGENMTAEELSGMSITINNVHDSASFDLRNGTTEAFDRRVSIRMNQTSVLSSEAIMLPGSTSGVDITVKLVNSAEYKAIFPENQHLNKGAVYHYNIIVNRTNMIIYPIGISDWTVSNDKIASSAKNISYDVGDFFPISNDPTTAIGIVYWTKPGSDGREGKIFSLDTASYMWGEKNSFSIENSIIDGLFNDAIIKATANSSSLDLFPAFKWCADKGSGWYLPARYELHVMNEQWLTYKDRINSNISLADGDIFMETDVYLSSSEDRTDYLNMAETYQFYDKDWPSVDKGTPLKIRAVKRF